MAKTKTAETAEATKIPKATKTTTKAREKHLPKVGIVIPVIIRLSRILGNVWNLHSTKIIKT